MTKPTITAYQIKDLEKDVEGLKADVTRVLTNHLPHIQNEVTEVRGDIGGLGQKFDEKIKALSDRVVVGVGLNVVMIIAGVVGVILLMK